MPNLSAMILAAAFLAPLAVQAAGAPTGPDALPALVVGVVGSGDQLALRFKPVGEAPARSLGIGEEFEDDWTLTALTPSTATLTKDGRSRTVGLNPTGTLADAKPAGGSTVTVLASAQASQLQADMALLNANDAVNQAQKAYAAATPETRDALLQAVKDARAAEAAAEKNTMRVALISEGVDPETADAMIARLR